MRCPGLHSSPFEVVERKGRGHPDTLSDALAEELSRTYAIYTRDVCGAILHHNFDKVGLLGGTAYVDFGEGRVVEPIRVLLNGRASVSFGGSDLGIHELLCSTVRKFFSERLPQINVHRDLEIRLNLGSAGSPGQVSSETDREGDRRHWFTPRSLEDIRELRGAMSNDTSAGSGYAPLSPTELCVLEVERSLNAAEYRRERLWLGTDIKVMAVRTGEELGLTICIPQIAEYVENVDEYRYNLDRCRTDLMDWAAKACPDYRIHLHINTSDDYKTSELYLTATGSAIESGDEGLVGRGNRSNGLISMRRPFTMEGASGKNPVYHVGKVYNVAAQQLAGRLYQNSGEPVEVIAVSQRLRALADPWKVLVTHGSPDLSESRVRDVVAETFGGTESITEDLLAGRVEVF